MKLKVVEVLLVVGRVPVVRGLGSRLRRGESWIQGIQALLGEECPFPFPLVD